MEAGELLGALSASSDEDRVCAVRYSRTMTLALARALGSVAVGASGACVPPNEIVRLVAISPKWPDSVPWATDLRSEHSLNRVALHSCKPISG